MVLVINNDLKMGKGKIAAQAAMLQYQQPLEQENTTVVPRFMVEIRSKKSA